VWWNHYQRVPFAEKGRDMNGADCWGLLTMIFLDQRKIELPGYEWCYEHTNDREALAAAMERERIGRWVQVENPQEFDVPLLRMRGVPMHVGVVTKPGYMIHCAKDINTVHERYDSMRWKNSVVGFFRYAAE
jgi:cell wall-associated NlpC family hydrolase